MSTSTSPPALRVSGHSFECQGWPLKHNNYEKSGSLFNFSWLISVDSWVCNASMQYVEMANVSRESLPIYLNIQQTKITRRESLELLFSPDTTSCHSPEFHWFVKEQHMHVMKKIHHYLPICVQPEHTNLQCRCFWWGWTCNRLALQWSSSPLDIENTDLLSHQFCDFSHTPCTQNSYSHYIFLRFDHSHTTKKECCMSFRFLPLHAANFHGESCQSYLSLKVAPYILLSSQVAI